ncbi:unnamed protein product, partial [Mesorhabditis belari]|uniref:Protein kinase domain-containing protein n=1 Tax=Mesorhabditis belari TaxID=2138241 RepID=A0AAF3J5T9_9BILA
MLENEKTACKLILFTKWRSKNEVEAAVPSYYQPDSNDHRFRDETIPPTTFHSIGHGVQGIVIAALLNIGGRFVRVAAKRYDVADAERVREDNLTKSNGYTKILRELQNTQYLVHENIVQMMDSFWEESPTGDIRFVWIVTERMDVDLEYYFEILKKNDNSSNPTLRDHRQLAAIPTNSKGIHSILPTLPMIYQPLEVALMDRYDCGVDVWSAGLVALEMLGCRLMMPLDGKAASVKERILDVLGLPDDYYSSFFGDRLRCYRPRKPALEQEISVSFQRLPSYQQFFSQENLMDLLKKIFEVNRQMRLTASECLEHPYLKEMNKKLESGEDVSMIGSSRRDKELLKSTLMKFSKKVAN